jgi:cytosine deaminase
MREGRGDQLEVALISAHAAHLTSTQEQRAVLDAVTAAPARAWRLGDTYGVVPGARADLQLYVAGSWADVLRLQEPPRAVWYRGRPVARTAIMRQLIR